MGPEDLVRACPPWLAILCQVVVVEAQSELGGSRLEDVGGARLCVVLGLDLGYGININ